MSGRIPAWVLTDEVIIRPFLGRSGTGPVYGDPVPHRCLVSEKRRLVRKPDGRELTSSTSVFLDPEAQVAEESQATLPSGAVTTVIEVRPHLHPGLPTPDHVQLMCE